MYSDVVIDQLDSFSSKGHFDYVVEDSRSIRMDDLKLS